MIRKFTFLFVVLIIGSYFMNLMNSCKGGTGTSENTDGLIDNELSISNDSLAYIMGEIVGEKCHKEYKNFKYNEDSVDLTKIAEEFDTVNILSLKKGFIEGLWIYKLSQEMGQMLHEKYYFDISPSKLRKQTLKKLEGSTNFISRESLPKIDYIKKCINHKDTASIYEVFAGYIACSAANMMKDGNINFTDCKTTIYDGISYSEKMLDKPAIDGLYEYIAIEAFLYLHSMNIDARFSQQIIAKAFKKTLINGSVEASTEKKQLLHSTLEELLTDFDELDRAAILSIIE